MSAVITRTGRGARGVVALALAALAACADEPAAPTSSPKIPGTPALAVEEIQVTVTNASGGSDVGSLQWAANQINDNAGNPGGVITFDPSLEGDTITLDAPLDARRPITINGPAKGITLSGNDQHGVISGGTSLTLRNLTLTKGYANFGSAVHAPSLYLYNTTVKDNRGAGSALYATWALRLVNSTVSGNVVGKPAVEYSSLAQVTIDNSTIAYNAPGAGIGPFDYAGVFNVTLRNSILANNGSPLKNCSTYAGFGYEGTNVVNDYSCADVAITPSDPQLMPLAYNGGPNMTHAIPHTSPAYNTGTACAQTTDQRYVARDAKCDVGAFEFNDSTKVTITIDPTARVDATTTQSYALVTGTMKCTREETIPLRVELRQEQRVGKEVVSVHGANTTQVYCTPTASTWARKVFLTLPSAWQSGAAQATAATYYTPDWVAPASVTSGVRLSVVRK